MSPEIKPVGSSSKINMLLHADTGWGKTSFIGSGGSEYRILIMRPPIDHVDPIIGSGVSEMVVRNWEDTFEGLDYMAHNGADWDWFWMDSISLLQDVGLDDVYEGVLDRAGPVGSDARKHRESFGPDRGEYRVNMWRLAKWIRSAVSDGSFHLGITAHSFWYEPDDNPAVLMPWIQGKGMPSKICGMMNLIGYGNIEEREVRGRTKEQRVIHWNKTADYYAKNQFKLPDGSSALPPFSVNPTLPEIMEAVMKGRPVTRGRRKPAAPPVDPTNKPNTRTRRGRPGARRK